MKILQVNKFYYPKGGADKYFLDLEESLKKAGHEVAVFSMADKKNLPSPFSDYFVSNFDFNNLNWRQKMFAPGRIIYNQEAKKKFRLLVENFQPDIIHIHNIYHQISPSILDVAKSHQIPVVMHLHDYKLICPNYSLFANGKPCEDCLPNKYFHCVKRRCFKSSLLKSLLVSLEMYIHHRVLKIYEKNISAFIAPSLFMKNKVTESGWPAEKISVIVNPYPEATEGESGNINEKKDYLLCFGRLSEEKGIDVLIKAAKNSHLPIKIAGSGPEEKNLKQLSGEIGSSVEFLGFQKEAALNKLIKEAKAVIIPSISYDNMPLSLLEAMHLGKIVIASKIGGIPEIITDGINGLLFESGNSDDLASKIKHLNNLSEEEIINLEKSARQRVENYSLENNCQAVINLYQQTLKVSK